MKHKSILIEKYIEPSEVIDKGYGIVVECWLDRNGDYHSFMGHPAYVGYNSDGQINYQEWYKKGVIYRDRNLPAIIYYDNEKIVSQFAHNFEAMMVYL
jgi:hypothetical protein